MKKFLLMFSLLFTLAVVGFQTFQQIGVNNIKIWDEARGAVNAIEMLQNHDYIVVRFDGEPDRWDTKSPFFIWFKVISYKIFGINEFAVRFPTAFFVLLSVFLMLYFFLRYHNSVFGGIISVLILTNSVGYMVNHVARTGEPDSILIFFILLYSLSWFYLLEIYPKKRNLLLAVFSMSFFLAIFTKNIAGVAPMAGVFVYTLIRFKVFKKLLKDYRVYLAIASALLLVVLYFVIREHFDPGYTQVVVYHEITGMFFHYFPGKPKNPEFNFYFKYIFNKGFKNYIFLLLLSIPVFFVSKNERRKRFIIFLYAFSVVFLLGYSKSVAKNEWYVAPVFPYLAMIIGISVDELFNIIKRSEKLKKYVKSILQIFLIFLLGGIILQQGIKVFEINTPDKQIFVREQAGYYLKKYHSLYPDIKQITVLSNYNSSNLDPGLDQVKFYIKKFNYVDSTNFSVQKNVTDELIGKNILTCDEKYVRLLEQNYLLKVIDFDNNSLICKVLSLDSVPKYEMYVTSQRYYDVSEIKYSKIDISKWFYNNIISIQNNYKLQKMYFWFKDSTLAIINYDFDSLTVKYSHFLPAKYHSTDDIVNVALEINSNTVYVFYKNDSVSSGTVELFDAKRKTYSMTNLGGYSSAEIVGCAIRPINNYTFYWFNDGTVSVGSTKDVTHFKSNKKFSYPLLFEFDDMVSFYFNVNNEFSTFYKFKK